MLSRLKTWDMTMLTTLTRGTHAYTVTGFLPPVTNRASPSLTEKLSTQIVNAENIPGAGAMSVGVRCSEAGPSSCPLAPSSAGEVQLDTSHAPAQTTQPCPAWLALPKSPGLAEKHFQWVV